MHGVFHPRPNISHLYMEWKTGKTGFISISDCVNKEQKSVDPYIAKHGRRSPEMSYKGT